MKRHEGSFLDDSLSKMKNNETLKENKQKEVEERILSKIDQKRLRSKGKQKSWMKKLIPAFALLLAVGISGALFLNETGENQQGKGGGENNQQNTLDDQNDDNNDDSNNNHEETSDENTEDDSQLTEDEAKEQVFDYIKENEPEIKDFLDVYQFSVKENDDKYQVNMFSPESEDPGIGSPLLSSYEVDRTTGDVEKIENEDDEAEPHLSEIVDLSEEERRAHHEELAVEPEYVSDDVYEHLMLPGIHENTREYEGRINPDETIMFEFPDAENASERSTFNPDVSEDGYFTVDVHRYKFEAGQDIRVYIMNGYPHEQTFDLPVHEAKEGMEKVEVQD